MYKLVYHPAVVAKDIPKLSAEWKAKIRATIELRLTTQPDLYSQPLRRVLKGYRKLRVSEYRVVFKIEEQAVYIIAIIHRSKVYKTAAKRL